MSGSSNIKKLTRHLLREDFPLPGNKDWREAVDKLLKGRPYNKIMLTETYEEITLIPQYRKADTDKTEHLDSLPGFAPYVRGVSAGGYQTKPWYIAQEISYADPAIFNKALLHDLKRGQDAVYLLLDQASAEGKTSGQSTTGKVGKNGTTIANFADFELALKGVSLEKTPIYLRSWSSALAMTAMLSALGQKQGVETNKICGAIEFDPLCQLLKYGELPASLDQLYDEMSKLSRWANKNAPNLQTIAINGDIFANGGANAVQEIAYSMGVAVKYIRELQKRGSQIDEIAPNIRFIFSIGSNMFMEIAKFRAVKIVWQNIIKNLQGDAESQKIHIHARSTSFNKTKLDPYINILRTTTESFAAILGGIESLHLSYFDELFNQASDFSRRIARNQQLILKEEANLERLIDPAGGSWYIENITAELSEKIWLLFQEIEREGGMEKAILAGKPQQKIAQTCEKRLLNLRMRKDLILGSNMHPNLQDKTIFKSNQSNDDFYQNRLNLETKQIDTDKVNPDDPIPGLISEVENGDISSIYRFLRKGDKRTKARLIKPVRGAQMFEYLRERMGLSRKKEDRVFSVFLVNIGDVSNYKARADFCKGFLEVGGFEVIYPPGDDNIEDTIKKAITSKANIFVICGNDKEYPQVVPLITHGIKTVKEKSTFLLAGYPREHMEKLKAAGIDEFIHVKADIYGVLSGLFEKSGVV